MLKASGIGLLTTTLTVSSPVTTALMWKFGMEIASKLAEAMSPRHARGTVTLTLSVPWAGKLSVTLARLACRCRFGFAWGAASPLLCRRIALAGTLPASGPPAHWTSVFPTRSTR